MSHRPDLDAPWFAEQVAEAIAAVEATRRERGIDPYHDSGADSGALSEDEEDERRTRGR